MRLLLCLLTILGLANTVGLSAQGNGDLPLVGPIVAVTPARQDHILLHDIGSGSTRSLSFGWGEHHVWGFSPDGCRVLFTVDNKSNRLAQMFTARLDGSDMRQMVRYDELSANAWGVWEPNWSPQDVIAFTMIRDQPQRGGEIKREYHVARINGTLTDERGNTPEFYSVTGREYTPQWSPDGTWLAYVSYDERVAGANVLATAEPTAEPLPGQRPAELPTLLEADMWVVSADAETKYRLTNFTTGSVRSPRWSPDGELIGFVYSPSPGNDTFWMIANQQGAIPTQLSFLWNLTLDHAWLPDSSAMLAAVRDFRGMNENRLWRVPLLGNADNDAAFYLPDNAPIYADYPRFSADGRYLAYRSEYSLVVYDQETGTWQQLDNNLPGNTPPVWTPGTFAGESSCE